VAALLTDIFALTFFCFLAWNEIQTVKIWQEQSVVRRKLAESQLASVGTTLKPTDMRTYWQNLHQNKHSFTETSTGILRLLKLDDTSYWAFHMCVVVALLTTTMKVTPRANEMT